METERQNVKIKNCPLRSECRKEADQRFFRRLFDTDWEVFVIKRDERTGAFAWSVRCCETSGVSAQ